MADTVEHKKEDPDRLKIDIFKVRIEEYDRNYFSLRDLEWRMALQFLSGYIAVGLAYHALRPTNQGSILLPRYCLGAVVLLFLTYNFFRFCLHQRLRTARALRNEYIDKLHAVQEGTKITDELDRHKKAWFVDWYALITQLVIHMLASGIVAMFILETWRGGPIP
jgi:hypothetical protein